MDGVMGTDLHVLVRFGCFEDVLAAPEPPQGWPVWHAFWRYARTLSFSGTARIEQAEAERQAFETERALLPAGALVVVNTASDVFRVASLMLEGELLFRRGQQDQAFAKLREAVTHEEALKYDEPPGWLQPVRHALGALLLEAGRHAEAEAVYREDLARHPDNGWALHGLAECLRARGASDEAAAATAAFQDAWARADTVIEASCFCRRTE
jgi:tetratricopeptide (TPR) repeat protein